VERRRETVGCLNPDTSRAQVALRPTSGPWLSPAEPGLRLKQVWARLQGAVPAADSHALLFPCSWCSSGAVVKRSQYPLQQPRATPLPSRAAGTVLRSHLSGLPLRNCELAGRQGGRGEQGCFPRMGAAAGMSMSVGPSVPGGVRAEG